MLPFELAQLSNQVNSARSSSESNSANEILSSIVTSAEILRDVIVSVIIIIVSYAIGRYIARRIIRALRQAQGETLYPDMVALVNRLSVFGSLFVGFAVVIQFVFELDFLQVVGFFGLGISFAFKDLLANLIAGAVVIIQNRFRVGDFIQIGQNGMKGKIMEIQTRATILKAIDGTEIVIPNAQLMTKPVITFTAHHRRRISFDIGVSFDTDLDKAQEIALEVMKSHENVLKSPRPHIIIKNVGDFAVTMSMRFYIDPQDKSYSWIKVRSQLVAQVKKAFDEAGIEIPYPVRTLKKGLQGPLTEGDAMA